MSGLLFLVEVVAFVLLAYWARRNDAIRLDEGGGGLFAMQDASGTKAVRSGSEPLWKRSMTGKRMSGPQAWRGAAHKVQPRWREDVMWYRRPRP